MIWKKSSSIVKWILPIISILEFTLPHLLYLLPFNARGMEVTKDLGFPKYLLYLSIINVCVAFFTFLFFQFYQDLRISVLDNSKNLMRKILKHERTVKPLCYFLFIEIYGYYNHKIHRCLFK